MALAGSPRLLLLDEPAAGLSPSERELLSRLLGGLPRTLAVLLIEHDMSVALAFADRITMLQDGEVVADGSPSEIESSAAVHEMYLGHHGA